MTAVNTTDHPLFRPCPDGSRFDGDFFFSACGTLDVLPAAKSERRTSRGTPVRMIAFFIFPSSLPADRRTYRMPIAFSRLARAIL